MKKSQRLGSSGSEHGGESPGPRCKAAAVGGAVRERSGGTVPIFAMSVLLMLLMLVCAFVILCKLLIARLIYEKVLIKS